MSTSLSALRETVRKRHMDDQESARSFIQTEWLVPGDRVGPVDMDSIMTYTVSTTSDSSLLLIAKGMQSMVTYNTYSRDSENPWLITALLPEENQGLAQHVQDEWDKMAIDPDGSRVEVNKIAAHVLYRRNQNGYWVSVPFSQSDSSNVVRFLVDDVEIWSHPPRDEPLKAALREKYEMDGLIFERAVKGLIQSAKGLDPIKRNTKIPSDKKPQAVQNKLDEIKHKFLEIYEYYKSVKIPDSYQWPTLQLGKRQGDGTELQRYGETYAGVYNRNANPVHMRFAAPGVEARELPTQKTVFDELLPHETFRLKFEDVIGS